MKQDYRSAEENINGFHNNLMHREILNHPLLLKKYSTSLIHDYTEYPTTKFNYKRVTDQMILKMISVISPIRKKTQ